MSDKKEKKEKKVKNPGPIRTGAVVPIVILVALVVLFSVFLLDSTIKKSIEFAGTQANGAEVNVGSVSTSFSDLKMVVSGIQFTDSDNPDFNSFEVGSLRFQMLWDALLRGKIVINTAEMNNILIKGKRSSRGHVLPPAPPSNDKDSKTQEVLANTKKEFDGNVIGDIAGVLGGGSTGDAGKNIEDSLESKKRFELLKVEIKEKEAALKTTFAKLPKQKEISALQKKIKNIRWKDLGNLRKAPKVLKEADSANKEIQRTLKAYDKANKQLNKSMKDINRGYKEAEALVKSDIENVGKRMKIPSIDPTTISKMLFGKDLLGKIEQAKKYQTMAKKYMPPKKDKKVEPIKSPRGKGRNYIFGTPNSYPLFWMKKTKIDSKNDQGTVAGVITDVTSNQNLIGKLTEIKMKADFPKEDIRDISAKVVLDFMKEPIARTNIVIGSYPVKNKALSDTDDARFIIRDSRVRTEFRGDLKEETASFKLNNSFSKINYEVSAKSPGVEEVLKDVANKTNILRLDAKAKGNWNDLKFDIKSNLAKAIQDSTKAVIQAKINKMKNKIKGDIEAQLAGTKKEINGQISKVTSQYTEQANKAQRELKKVTSGLKKQRKAAEKKAKRDAAKNLLKNFKL